MSKRLFVGGLPFTATSSQLEEIFSKFGKIVSCDVIVDRYSGQSKGFGFVEMEDDKEADEAIAKLNETELEGRKIAVNVARPREERPRSDSRGGGPRRDDDRGPRRGGYR
jgi:RNA recognition motif-containing protein